MNTVAIIQARMGSSRLPGKIFADICGYPMLWHVANRLKACSYLDNIVVATTALPQDDCVQNFCQNYGIDFYRGSAEDVLDRYYQASLAFGADAVVRITSDCPLLDPQVADTVVSRYLEGKKNLDGASNVIQRTFPRGLDCEIFSLKAVESAWKQAKLPYQREHVTVYIHEHPQIFKVYSLTNEPGLGSLRWTVDEEADLEFVRCVYKALFLNENIFGMADVLALLKKEPGLAALNCHIKQKAPV